MGKVFISYSHDSKEHAEKVLSFANLLRKDGIDCVLDQYTPHPPEGWPGWMENNIESAEFVLLICTQTYLNRVTGKEESGKGLGVKWEGKLIYNRIYESDSVDGKFIPVLFTYDDKKYIPSPLKGQTFYTVTDKIAYIDLYRRLTHQPEITMPELGKRKTLGTKEVEDFFSRAIKGEQHVRIETTKLPITSPILYGRENQLKLLDQAWENPHTRVISFIAFGGVGKSALVNAWLNNMEADNYRGAECVYGWSFYSQGVTEQTQASADAFFNDCLTWFGYTGKPG